MLIHLLYNESMWVMAALIILIFLGGSISLQFLATSLTSKNLREKHTNAISYGLATVSIFVAVLVAFITVISWQSYGDVQAAVEEESQLAGTFYRHVQATQGSARKEISDDINAYLDQVINVEWPAMTKNERQFDEGWSIIFSILQKTEQVSQKTLLEANLYMRLQDDASNLIKARRNRILFSEPHLKTIIWLALTTTAFINIFFFCLLYLENRKFHLFLTTLIGFSFGITFTLIAAFDRPFQGPMAISASNFELTKMINSKYLAPLRSNSLIKPK